MCINHGPCSCSPPPPRTEQMTFQDTPESDQAYISQAPDDVKAVYRALQARLVRLQGNVSGNQEEIYRIRRLLSLSQMDVQKCETNYLTLFETAAKENMNHVANIRPYILYFARQQLVQCREVFTENLHRVLGTQINEEIKSSIILLNTEVEQAGCEPLRGSVHDGYLMPRNYLMIGMGSFMCKNMRTNPKTGNCFTRLRDYFDDEFERLIQTCQTYLEAIEPQLIQFDKFTQTDKERLHADDFKWLSGARACEQILLYVKDTQSVEEALLAFNQEAVARPRRQDQ